MKSRSAIGVVALLSLPGWSGAQSTAVDLPVGYSLSSAYVDDSGDGILALMARNSSRLPTGLAFGRLSNRAEELLFVTGMLDYYSVWHLAENRFILRGIGDPPREPEAMQRHYSEVVLVEVRRDRAEIMTERPVSVYVDYETIQRPSRDGKYWIESERYVWANGEGRPRPINEEALGSGVRFGVYSLDTGELERTLFVEFPGLELRRNPVFEVIESEGPVLALSLGGLVHILRFSGDSLSSEYLSMPAAAPSCGRPLGVLARWQPSEERLWVRRGTSSRGQPDWVAFDLWSAGLNRVSPVFPGWQMTESDMWPSARHSDIGANGERRFVYPHLERGVVAVRSQEQRYLVQHTWRDLRVPGVFEVQSSDWVLGGPMVSSEEGPKVWVSANGRHAVVQEARWTRDDEESRPAWVAERRREGRSRYFVRRIELHRTYTETDPLGQPVELPVEIRWVGPDEKPTTVRNGVGRLNGVERIGTEKSEARPKTRQREGTYAPGASMESAAVADCGVVGPRLVWVEN